MAYTLTDGTHVTWLTWLPKLGEISQVPPLGAVLFFAFFGTTVNILVIACVFFFMLIFLSHPLSLQVEESALMVLFILLQEDRISHSALLFREKNIYKATHGLCNMNL
jgi:Zn-dependent protease with chaperone function